MSAHESGQNLKLTVITSCGSIVCSDIISRPICITVKGKNPSLSSETFKLWVFFLNKAPFSFPKRLRDLFTNALKLNVRVSLTTWCLFNFLCHFFCHELENCEHLGLNVLNTQKTMHFPVISFYLKWPFLARRWSTTVDSLR